VFCLPVSSNSRVISVIIQISTSVPRTTEVVALKPTAATLQEATRAPVSQDTPGMESPVQVCKQRRMLNIVYQTLFGRPLVKRFALCYPSVVCLCCAVLFCLSVTLMYCGQTVGPIKMKLSKQAAGRSLPCPHCVRWGPSSISLPQRA